MKNSKIPLSFARTIVLCIVSIVFSVNFVSAQAALNAPSIQSGVTFQWSDSQSAPDDSATLQSVTVDGTIYNRLGVPTSYTMTQLGPTGDAANNIRLNGGFTETTSASGTWDASALTAFDDKNINHYFEANGNGQNICDDYTAESTTTAQRQTLTYSPGIEVSTGGLLAVTERNANNCFHVELFGTPVEGGAIQSLGETFVNQTTTQWGYGGTGSNGNFGTPGAINPPNTDSDYWLSDRVIDNYGTIGIALFVLDDIADVGDIITSVQLTAATTDHGDGKVFIISFLDEDGDGIDDSFDLDDDNDGILDADEDCNGSNDADILTTFGVTNITSGNDGTYTTSVTDITYAFDESGGIDIETLNLAGGGQQGPVFKSNASGAETGAINQTFAPHIRNVQFKITDFDGDESVLVEAYDTLGNLIDLSTGTYTTLGTQVQLTGNTVFTTFNNNVDGDLISSDPTGSVLFNFTDVSLSRLDFTITHASGSSLRFTQLNGFCADVDTDGDGIPDYLDTDSDGDGCFDALEGGDNILASEVDANGALTGTSDPNGVPNNVNTTTGQTPGTSTNATTFDSFGQCDSDNDGTIDTNDLCPGFDDNANNDGDAYPDGCDLDDDNDGISDIDEGLVTTPGQPACGGETVLNFNNAYTEESGDGDINTFFLNDTFRFPGVSAGIDALVTITELNGTTIPVFDDNVSNPNSFQPRSAFTLTNIGDRAYSEFRFDFVTAGGIVGVNDVVIPEFFVNFNDVDGRPSYSEQNWSQLPNGYVVDNPTELLITSEGNFIVGTAGVVEYPEVTNNFPQINYSTVHSGKSSYTIRLGVVAREAGASASGRQHNVEFDCITNFVNPGSTTVVDSDGDGIPNHLDLDSDDDGCFDALEGNGGISLAQIDGTGVIIGTINTNGIPNAANSGAGQADVSSTNDLVVGAECGADLSLTKTIDNATPSVGDTIIYTLILTNSGPSSATDVEVRDVLPTGLVFDLGNSTIPASTTYDAITGIWSLSTLTINNGDSFTLEIAATVSPACGEITNIAEIISSNNTDSDSTIDNGN